MTDHHHHNSGPPLAHIGRLLSRLRAELQTIIIYAVAIGLLSLATPIAVQVLINTIAFGGVTQPLVVVAILLALALSLSAFFRTAQTIVVEMLSRRIFVETATRFTKNLAISIRGTTPHAKLRILTNRFYDVVTVEKALWSWLLEGAAALLQIPLGLSLLALYHPFLLAFGLAITAGALFIVFVLGRGAIRTAIAESHEKHRLVSRMEEISEAPTLFASAAGRENAMRTILARSNGWLAERETHFRIVLRQMVGFWALEVLASALLLIIGGGLVIAGQLTLGQLVAAELVIALTVGSLSKIAKLLPKVYDAEASLIKLASIADLNLKANESDSVNPTTVPARLRAEDVVFAAASEALSEPISFAAEKNSVTRVVGCTAVLNAFVDALFLKRKVLSGKLLLGDRPIELWTLDEIHDKVHLISDRWLHNRSVAEQLRIAAPDADDDTIMKVLNTVGLGQILASHRREGCDEQTIAYRLKPDHRFAIGVARALLVKPAVVVCPPALCGLSPQWRSHLNKVLSDPSNGWSCLVLEPAPSDSGTVSSTVVIKTSTVDQPEVLS